MTPSGVIFDCDGVIIDSEDLHLKAWASAFEHMTGQIISQDSLQKLRGRHTLAIAQELSARSERYLEPANLCKIKLRILLSQIEKAPLIKGVREFWIQLQELEIPIGVASNSPLTFVETQLKHHKLEPKVALGREQVGEPKPSPEIFLRCASDLGINLSEHHNILVFEDSPHGIRAGIRAGMKVIGVTTHHSSDILHTAGASFTLPYFNMATAENYFSAATK